MENKHSEFAALCLSSNYRSEGADIKGLTVMFAIMVPAGECSDTFSLYVGWGNFGLTSLVSVMLIVTVAVAMKLLSLSSMAITYTMTPTQHLRLETCFTKQTYDYLESEKTLS